MENHLDHLEDNRFIEIDPLPADYILPFLDWHLDQDDYLVDEILGFTSDEIDKYANASARAFDIFVEATNHLIDNKHYAAMGIPASIVPLIEYSWKRRLERHPFFYGRFDLIENPENGLPKVIEFNADTCTMVPETMHYHPAQIASFDRSMGFFNSLRFDILDQLAALREQFAEDYNPVIIGASLGHPDDHANIESLLDVASTSFRYSTIAMKLEDVVFSDEGAFIQEDDGYIKADILLKMFPWDWMYNEEPELLHLLSDLVMKDELIVLNPAYTTIWQNKRFLNYITTHFPNSYIAKSSDRPTSDNKLVAKSSGGRLGEEVTIMNNSVNLRTHHAVHTYQEWLPLPQDEEGNYYQFAMYFTDKPSAFNIRCQENPIISEDCEFYSHYIID